MWVGPSTGEEANVIKTLVSVDVDLVSSLALRFACQLGGVLPLEVQPMYVKEGASRETIMHVGWASRTWEREMVQEGKQEISELISAEQDYCLVLKEPKVAYGDRETELLKAIQSDGFGLYVEGGHTPWNATTLYKQLHSKLHQRLDCPVVIVRALRKLEEVLVLCLDPDCTAALAKVFGGLWSQCPVPIVLAVPHNGGSGKDRERLMECLRSWEELGVKTTVKPDFPSIESGHAEEAMKHYGLVAIATKKEIGKDSLALHWLSLVRTSCLVALD
jgi:hypothetical protein